MEDNKIRGFSYYAVQFRIIHKNDPNFVINVELR